MVIYHLHAHIYTKGRYGLKCQCREADFNLYVEVLIRLVPWFFALGHSNYARWIPVHLRDMVNLKELHPSVYEQFMCGNFTVKKAAHAFSAIAIDQAHEQNNAIVKGDGGAIGLIENSQLFCDGWLVARRQHGSSVNLNRV